MMTKNSRYASLLAVVLASGLPAVGSAATLDLTGIGFVQYGDGQSYSLPIAGLQVGDTGPGSQFYVNSTPGAIKDLIVVATGSSGGGVTTNVAGIEGAYATPSGVSGSTFFSTTLAGPQGATSGTIANASALTWDANLASLQTFLGGDQMIFFFNNNQTTSGDALTQTLAAWARITITDPSGAVIGTFDFTNDGGVYALVSEGGGGTFLGDVTTYTSTAVGAPGTTDPLAGDNAATDYVLSGGAICLDTDNSGGAPVPPGVPVPVSCGNPDADTAAINHNLGANQAAYALLAPELNALLDFLFANAGASLGDYTMHIDLRMGCDPATLPAGAPGEDSPTCTASPHGRSLNNGYEQLFIGTAETIIQVPEPDTIALLGLGLLGLLGIGAVSRRRKIVV